MSEQLLFISHVSEDRAAAEAIVVELEKREIRCWVAPRDLRSNADLRLDTFNPNGQAMAFLGTEMLARKAYVPGENGIAVEVRAGLSPVTPGIVAGIFLYAYQRDTELHDEIDFELLSDMSAPNRLHFLTNVYSNEPFGAGHPQYVADGELTEFHTYRIEWFVNRVRWFVDNRLVRETDSNIPLQPMALHLNLWAPDTTWPDAYDVRLQPATSPSNSTSYHFSISYARMEFIRQPER